MLEGPRQRCVPHLRTSVCKYCLSAGGEDGGVVRPLCCPRWGWTRDAAEGPTFCTFVELPNAGQPRIARGVQGKWLLGLTGLIARMHCRWRDPGWVICRHERNLKVLCCNVHISSNHAAEGRRNRTQILM